MVCEDIDLLHGLYNIYFWMVRETVGACIGRVLSGGKGPLVFRKAFCLGYVVVSVVSRYFLLVRNQFWPPYLCLI